MHAVYYPDRLVRFTHTCAHIPHYRPGLGLSSILLTLLLKKMHDKNPRSSIYRVLLQLSSRTVLPQTFPFFSLLFAVLYPSTFAFTGYRGRGFLAHSCIHRSTLLSGHNLLSFPQPTTIPYHPFFCDSIIFSPFFLSISVLSLYLIP